MRQALGPGALGRPRWSGWRGRLGGGSGWGTHVNPWLFHFSVWQNSLQIKKIKKIVLSYFWISYELEIISSSLFMISFIFCLIQPSIGLSILIFFPKEQSFGFINFMGFLLSPYLSTPTLALISISTFLCVCCHFPSFLNCVQLY